MGTARGSKMTATGYRASEKDNERKPRRERRGNLFGSRIACQACNSVTEFKFRKPNYFEPSVVRVICKCKAKFLIHVLKDKNTLAHVFQFRTDIEYVSDEFKRLWIEKEAAKKPCKKKNL